MSRLVSPHALACGHCGQWRYVYFAALFGRFPDYAELAGPTATSRLPIPAGRDASARLPSGSPFMARSSKARVPNGALRALLTESGWTEDLLARKVNALAAEIGRAIRLDRRSVSHWLSGRHPRPPIPGLIAEALSRRLGREITVAHIGMDARNHPQRQERHRTLAAADPHLGGGKPAQPKPTAAIDRNAVAVLRQLAETTDSDVYRLAALVVPHWEEAVTRQPSRLAGAAAPSAALPQLTADQVAAPERMVRAFSDLDSAFGGGHSRRALAAYLGHDLAPRLRAPANLALHRKMLSAATQLTYLCGFMCFDDEQHAMAQQYYRAALDMAAEAGDRGAYTITLRALSVQAHALGHHREALHLAEAATAGATKVPAEQQAFLFGQLAVAAAADGDRVRARSALGIAENRLSRATTDSPVGGYHSAAMQYQQAIVRAQLNDLPGAISALTRSIRHRPPTERRSRSITLAQLGEFQLRRGHLEEAVATWHSFLDDYPHLRSGRAVTALATMRSRLIPFATNPAAARLMTRTAAVHLPTA
jgi:tetratricopeptide (TPR) repeat protein